MTPFLSPEITPAQDEHPRPEIGPNLAGNQELCRAASAYVYRDALFPYMLQQQRYHPIWRRIDDAWRVKGERDDLDISYISDASKKTSPDGKGDGLIDGNDGWSAKVYPAAAHKQIRNKTDTHMSVSWSDGKLPIRAIKPDTIYEDPLYNPTSQGVDAINELLKQCASQVQMKQRDRLLRGCWSKYGHAWLHCDFKYRLIDQRCTHVLPPDPQIAMQNVQALAQQYGGQAPEYGAANGQPTATWIKRTVDPDSMVTDFVPLRHDAVFIDQTISAADMDAQPCPIVRNHVTRFQLWGNDYDPETNPFGWLNIQQALSENLNHYTLSAQDEISLRQEMQKKWGLSCDGLVKPKNTIKQRWTAYPLLAIDPDTGKLDEGEGVECPACQGRKQVPVVVENQDPLTGHVSHVDTGEKQACPKCAGIGKVYIRPERYVMEMFGVLSSGAASVTVLRIQKIPTVKGRVPILFGAHLTEDTAGAIPLATAEALMKAADQLATAHNQFLDAKTQIIQRPWFVQSDEPSRKMNFNRPGRSIELEVMTNARPADTVAFDVTQTLPGYMEMLEREIQDLGGFSPTLLGQVAQGRRSANEIQTAADAAKLPLTIEIDSCNTQIHGRWAQMHIDNIEAFGDRDWIQKRTGRTTFGRVHIYCNTAEDYFGSAALIGNVRYMLEASNGDPSINRASLWKQLARAMKMPDPDSIANDGGMAMAQQKGFQIIARILADGIPVPPAPDDPDEIYIAMFQAALNDPDWQERAPQNLQLLFQRLQIQQLQQQEKMIQQMEQQRARLALSAPLEPGNGNKPKRPGEAPSNPSEAKQAEAGRNAPQ